MQTSGGVALMSGVVDIAVDDREIALTGQPLPAAQKRMFDLWQISPDYRIAHPHLTLPDHQFQRSTNHVEMCSYHFALCHFPNRSDTDIHSLNRKSRERQRKPAINRRAKSPRF
jgi:hypothetical protein